MGYVTSLFARKVVAAAGDGVDAAAMLSSVGIDPEGTRYYNAERPHSSLGGKTPDEAYAGPALTIDAAA